MVLKEMNDMNFNQENNVFDPHYPNNYSHVSIIKQGYAQKNVNVELSGQPKFIPPVSEENLKAKF